MTVEGTGVSKSLVVQESLAAYLMWTKRLRPVALMLGRAASR